MNGSCTRLQLTGKNARAQPSHLFVTMSTPAETQTPHSPATRKNSGLHLPLEIITLIVSFIPIGPDSQSQLHALTLVSRSFYSASVARLYHSPHLRGWRFELFVRTVCPSINSWIKRNGLSDFTVRLDLSRLVHEARKSVTARLLGRLKGRLEFFAAPQASFGYYICIESSLR